VAPVRSQSDGAHQGHGEGDLRQGPRRGRGYLYRLLVPLDEDDEFPAGASPNATAASSDNFIGPDDFDDTLLDAEFAIPKQADGTPVSLPTVTEVDPVIGTSTPVCRFFGSWMKKLRYSPGPTG